MDPWSSIHVSRHAKPSHGPTLPGPICCQKEVPKQAFAALSPLLMPHVPL